MEGARRKQYSAKFRGIYNRQLSGRKPYVKNTTKIRYTASWLSLRKAGATYNIMVHEEIQAKVRGGETRRKKIWAKCVFDGYYSVDVLVPRTQAIRGAGGMVVKDAVVNSMRRYFGRVGGIDRWAEARGDSINKIMDRRGTFYPTGLPSYRDTKVDIAYDEIRNMKDENQVRRVLRSKV